MNKWVLSAASVRVSARTVPSVLLRVVVSPADSSLPAGIRACSGDSFPGYSVRLEDAELPG